VKETRAALPTRGEDGARRSVWWTAADRAETTLLVHELVRVAFVHRERCPECAEQGTSCAKLRDAVEATVGWHDRRALRSRAAWLAEQEITRLAELRARARALLEGDVRAG
jgi:hypothetical protein